MGFVSTTECIDTNTQLGSAIFAILGAVAQLERDLIAERVRNGLANAKAKGIHIGRVKMRESDLIRKLIASKMTYRSIAKIAKCSTGAVSAEVKAIKAEAQAIAKNKAREEALLPKLEIEHSPTTKVVSTGHLYQEKDFDFGNQETSFVLEQ